MELNIIQEIQNPLFPRKEITATVTSNINPSNEDVITALSEKYSVAKNAIRVDSIRGKFGVTEFTIKANIYQTNKDRDEIEKLTKKELEAEKKAAEPIEEVKKEAPTEEKTPETKPVEEVKVEKVPETKPVEEVKKEAPTEEKIPETKPVEEKQE